MINHRVQKYIEDHSFCSEYLFRDWEAFLDFIYEEGYRVSSILWWEHCKKNFQHGYGGYSDPDDREWMYSETWLHEDGFRPGFMKMDLKKKALRILRHIFMKPERMVLFLVTNTSATIWCRPSILQMNRLRFAEILPAQVFVRVIQNEL